MGVIYLPIECWIFFKGAYREDELIYCRGCLRLLKVETSGPVGRILELLLIYVFEPGCDLTGITLVSRSSNPKRKLKQIREATT